MDPRLKHMQAKRNARTLVGIGKGPGMFDISAFLGKEETLKRMRKAIEVLG